MITGTKTARNLVFPWPSCKVQGWGWGQLKVAVHCRRNIWTCVQRVQTLCKAQKPTAFKLISTQEEKPVQIYKRAHAKLWIWTGPDLNVGNWKFQIWTSPDWKKYNWRFQIWTGPDWKNYILKFQIWTSPDWTNFS